MGVLHLPLVFIFQQLGTLPPLLPNTVCLSHMYVFLRSPDSPVVAIRV